MYGARIGHYSIIDTSVESAPQIVEELTWHVNVITNNNSLTYRNISCFGAFTDTHTGTVYNVLTGVFPFMSLEGNMRFLVVYHYKSNAILGLPIANMEDDTVFAALKKQFEFLESNGHKIKLNVMDNQAYQQIQRFLTQQECDLLLVEPHNHCVNDAKHVIQTFKDHIVSALATTNSEFPFQL